MNIIKFPGYLHPEKKLFLHAGRRFTDFKAMVRGLSEVEIARMTEWHLKRLGGGNWHAALLTNSKLRQA
jgi:hypothetical protein